MKTLKYTVGVDPQNAIVVLNYGQDIQWVGLDIPSCDELINTLLDARGDAAKGSGEPSMVTLTATVSNVTYEGDAGEQVFPDEVMKQLEEENFGDLDDVAMKIAVDETRAELAGIIDGCRDAESSIRELASRLVDSEHRKQAHEIADGIKSVGVNAFRVDIKCRHKG